MFVIEVNNLVIKKEGSSYKEGETPIKKIRVERRYNYYGEVKYNSYIYKVEIKDIEDSDTSK